MNLIGWAIRLLASALLFLLTFLVGTVPIYLYQKWNRRKTRPIKNSNSVSEHGHTLSANFCVQVVTQMGGGILFFTVLVHMIPEVRNSFEKHLKSNHSLFYENKEHNTQTGDHSHNHNHNHSPPYLEIAICIGFFATYLTEVVMHSLLNRKHDSKDRIKTLNDSGVGVGLNKNENFEMQKSLNNGIDKGDHQLDKGTNKHGDEPIVIVICCDELQGLDVKSDRLRGHFLHGLVIIGSFSVHSILEGFSIGVRTESNQMWTMFIAIASHKLMIALIISVELYEKCQNFLLVIFHMIVFSIMSPIGIIAVVIAEKSIDTDSEVNPIVILLSAIASGTLLYIVFFEILQKDRVSKLSPITRFTAMFVGFGLMFIISIVLIQE